MANVSNANNSNLKVFSGEVLTAFNAKKIFLDLVTVKKTTGASASFPVIGTMTDTLKSHTPGDVMTSNTVSDGEVVIAVDALKYETIFLDKYEETMASFDSRAPLSAALGNKMGRAIESLIITQVESCITATAKVGQPATQGTLYDAGILSTDTKSEAGDKVLDAIYEAETVFGEKNIEGTPVIVVNSRTKNQLVLANLLTREYKSNIDNNGSDTGKVDMVAGFEVVVSNVLTANTAYVLTTDAVGLVKLMDLNTTSQEIFDRNGTMIKSTFAYGIAPLNPGCVFGIDVTAV